MIDSESDTSYNVFYFGNVDTTTVYAKGPNTNFSWRNPMPSTICMPRKYERPRYTESAYDRSRMYHRRETSPMSIQSAYIRPQNFQQCAGTSSRQLQFNVRSGSPVSMRSIESSASVSSVDIALAFKNAKFNKNELKLIGDAYQKYLNPQFQKRVKQRRKYNKTLLLKGRRRSGDDSGEQASDSSVSSDDYKSAVGLNKENKSSSSSARTDLTDIRKTFEDRNKHIDSSDDFRQNTFKNKFPVGSSSIINTQNFNNAATSNDFNSMPTQKDRFRNGVALPSPLPSLSNRSIASSGILENVEKPHRSKRNNVRNHYAQNNHKKRNCPSASEDEIFSEINAREKRTFNIDSQCKRNLDSEDESSLPIGKKTRITSPAKSALYNKRAPPKLKNINPSNNNVELSNCFEFAKPSLPARKSKQRVQEKLIAKSSQPLTDYLRSIPNTIQDNIQILQPSNLKEKSSNNLTQLDQTETTQSSDVSSRPSFFKRKLITQQLDDTEKANLSTDAAYSPQSNVYSLQKEKNISRKLVTHQSGLNREVEDDNDLLDSIHPPDRMNLTNQITINQNKNDVNNKIKKDNEAKWNVASVISICNEDNVSGTYTEKIFEADNIIKVTSKNKDINSKANPVVTNTLKDCLVMVKKLESNNTLQKQVVNQNFNTTHNNDTKNNARTFWDTDFESIVECQTVLPRSHVADILKKANTTLDTTKQDFKNPVGKKSLDVPKHLINSLTNSTVTTFNSVHKLNTRTLSVRSHRTCCTYTNKTKSKLENPGDKKKDNSEDATESNLGMINPKAKDIQSKNSSDMPKSKFNKQNEKNSTISRSTSQSKKNPKENKLIKDKRAVSPKNKNMKSESKSEKSSSVNNKKSNTEAQNNKTPIKNKAEKQNESIQVKNDNIKYKIQSDKQQSKKLKTSKSKPKSKSDCQNDSMPSKKNNSVLQPTNLNLNNTEEPIQNTSFISGRPIRSCRISNLSRSIELSVSAQVNNTSGNIIKSLRSRDINELSSSIENITIKIKPKNKINKNISQINPRESDVSFSLGSKEQTPVAKTTSARSRANFKRKRKP